MEKKTWQGNVIAKVQRGTRNQVWSLVGDFLGLHKLHPMISTCRLVEGVPGQPGCVRYCSDVPPTDDVIGEAPSNLWVNERLLSLDPIGQSLSYEITENNMGFTRYVATLKVVGGGGADDDGDEDGCSLEWCFEADPVDGFSEEGLVSILQNGLDGMAAKVEDALHACRHTLAMAPIPCLKGCGFFGDPEQRNLCSQCYKDEILAPVRASIQDQINREIAMKNLRALPLPPLPRIKTKIVTKTTKRCESCKRKIGLTGFKCKCGGEFCSAHRLPESLAAEKDSLDIIQHDWALPKIEHGAEQVLRKLLR